MQEKIKTTILNSENLFGGERYALTVEVINLSSKPLSNVSVKPQILPGKNLTLQADLSYSEISVRDYEKRAVIQEMNQQSQIAYKFLRNTRRFRAILPIEDNRAKNENSHSVDKLKNENLLIRAIRFIDDLYEPSEAIYSLNLYKKSLAISSLEDVEHIEKLIMSRISDDSFLKKAFLSNKERLKIILSSKTSQADDLNESFLLQPGQIISFTFYSKAPHLLHQRKTDVQFEFSYIEDGEEPYNKRIISRQIVRKTLVFYASGFSISLGVVLGGISGFVVKNIFISPTGLQDLISKGFWSNFLPSLIGTILLSCILSIAVKRSDESRKFVTVEDFSGGFIVGAIAGMFSNEILVFLRGLLK